MPRVNTIHGLHSLRYSSTKRRNDIDESVGALDKFKDFKDGIHILTFIYLALPN